MENVIETYVDPVSGKNPQRIKKDDVLVVYCTTSYENDMLKQIKITVVQKGDIKTTYHENLDSADLEYTLRNLYAKLGDNFKFNKKHSIIINSAECDIEKFKSQKGRLKDQNVVLPFKDGTVVELNPDDIYVKGLKDISKPKKSKYHMEFDSGSM